MIFYLLLFVRSDLLKLFQMAQYTNIYVACLRDLNHQGFLMEIVIDEAAMNRFEGWAWCSCRNAII